MGSSRNLIVTRTGGMKDRERGRGRPRRIIDPSRSPSFHSQPEGADQNILPTPVQAGDLATGFPGNCLQETFAEASHLISEAAPRRSARVAENSRTGKAPRYDFIPRRKPRKQRAVETCSMIPKDSYEDDRGEGSSATSTTLGNKTTDDERNEVDPDLPNIAHVQEPPFPGVSMDHDHNIHNSKETGRKRKRWSVPPPIPPRRRRRTSGKARVESSSDSGTDAIPARPQKQKPLPKHRQIPGYNGLQK